MACRICFLTQDEYSDIQKNGIIDKDTYYVIRNERICGANSDSPKERPDDWWRIRIALVPCILVIVSYCATYNLPELYRGIDVWYNLLFQLAVAFTVSALFYHITVRLPMMRKREAARKVIGAYIDMIKSGMDDVFYEIMQSIGIEIDVSAFVDYINQIEVVDFGATSKCHALPVSQGEKGNECPIGIIVSQRIDEINKDIVYILSMYNLYMPLFLVETLERILNSDMHEKAFIGMMKKGYVFDFSSCRGVFHEYYAMRNDLMNA